MTASKELTSQAQMLKIMVDEFTIKEQKIFFLMTK